MARIHPLAVVDSAAELADDVQVGPFCVIRGPVTVAAGTVIHEHSVVAGLTQIGAQCMIGPAAYVGTPPQHRGYNGEPRRITIGDRVIVRENACIHPSIYPDKQTTVGDDTFLMTGAHIGHDCQIGKQVTVASNVLFGGHVEVGDLCFIGGGAAVHQFVRIGRLAILAGNEATSRDVPPFAAMRYLGLKGFNWVGCRRANLSPEVIRAIRGSFHLLLNTRKLSDAVVAIEAAHGTVSEVAELLAFLRSTKRGIVPSLRFANWHRTDDDE